MTDERMGERLWSALRCLPPGAGVVFRHHATPASERRALLRRVERIATARRLVLVVAVADGGSDKAGVHGQGHGRRLRSASAHDRRQAIAGVRRGAAVLFVSPVFATRSHPGAPALGPMRAARIGSGLGAWVVALGGMDARRWRRIARLGFDGWAAIDAWMREPETPALGALPPRLRPAPEVMQECKGPSSGRRQKRNTVPT